MDVGWAVVGSALGQDQLVQEIRPLFTQGLKAQTRARVIPLEGEQEAGRSGNSPRSCFRML